MGVVEVSYYKSVGARVKPSPKTFDGTLEYDGGLKQAHTQTQHAHDVRGARFCSRAALL